LRKAGHEVCSGSAPIESNVLAVREARRLGALRPAITIFNIPVWAFPHFALLAASELRGPLLLFSNISPEYPGMVGMLAAAGGLDQLGRAYGRAWGDIGEPAVADRVLAWVAAGAAYSGLRGKTFGRIGGRPMGMYTAVANTDQWIDKYIFPGGFLPSVSTIAKNYENHDWQLLDYENLRLHYAMTLHEWRERFEKNKDRVIKMYGETFYRMWRLYLAGSESGFRWGDLGLSQFVFSKGVNNDLPLTREHLYR